jgi:hypothetical protein
MKSLVTVVMFLAIILCGCKESNTDANQPKKMDSVTYTRPADKKVDTVLLLDDLAVRSGIKEYLGAKLIKADTFNREDGGVKYLVEFSTLDSVEKVKAFYEAEKLDVKVTNGKGDAQGKTKTDCFVLMTFGPNTGEKGTLVSMTVIQYPPK